MIASLNGVVWVPVIFLCAALFAFAYRSLEGER